MAASDLSVVIHGHFYQPPRDDPWFETVETQATATPFHDWNERVTEECYRAIVAARIPGNGGRIARIVNTLESISFNFGPTLLEWIEKEAPDTYRAILHADAKSSTTNGGHGNALAQAYHHTILPLASRREKVTEVRWGMADFRKRFGREPVGMWLPETAVDAETLDVLAQEGIAFTIVAPHQIKNPPTNGLPGVFRTSSGGSVALFAYNGPLSHGVAFGALLSDAEKWAQDMVGSPDEPTGEGLVSIATDGETYGHHHKFGEMALASVLARLHEDPRVRVENFASFLFRNPPVHEVELEAPSSWSCSHGVERWRADCGCKMDPSKDTQQEWRTGLRDAMDWLASEIHLVFDREGRPLLGNPWEARDRSGPQPTLNGRGTRSLELLELERHALRLFTSCGWFFDDLAGLEPLQVLRYAARALELLGPGHEEIREDFLELLDSAVTNETPPRTGRQVFLEDAVPSFPAHLQVGAGSALWDMISPDSQGPGVPAFQTSKMAPDIFRVVHRRTQREWEVETEIRRPSEGAGIVAARIANTSGKFIPMVLADLPEGFRLPIMETLTRKMPRVAEELISAVEKLESSSQLREPAARVQDLADLLLFLGEPIPFEAQTTFFRIFENAPPRVVEELWVLRKPLGFTTLP
jgi:hypothetical protein